MKDASAGLPIYLVSLPQDYVRRERLATRFLKYYKSFIYVEAVDGRKLSAKEFYDATLSFFIKYKRPMSPAELGCTLSHMIVLRSFLATDANFALILEDDIIGNDEDIDLISDLTTKLDQDSLLLCGGQEGISGRYQLGKHILEKGVHEVDPFSYRFMHRTCCYVVSRKAAEEILAHHIGGATLADKWDSFFMTSSVNLYYFEALKHPLDLAESHIEKDREVLNPTGFINKLLSRNGLSRVFNKLKNEVFYFYLRRIIGREVVRNERQVFRSN